LEEELQINLFDNLKIEASDTSKDVKYNTSKEAIIALIRIEIR